MKIFSPKVVGQGGLPPHRPGINHAIELEKNEFRRKKEYSLGPFIQYNERKIVNTAKNINGPL
jgi:hypothetical protein